MTTQTLAAPTMRVTKRDGRREAVRFDKITHRLEHLRALEPRLAVDVTPVAARVCASVKDGISTSELDELAADVAAGMSTDDPEYGSLAARVLVSNLQKSTSKSVLDTFERMAGVLDPAFLDRVRRHSDKLQQLVDYRRDFDFDFFGFKTMERMYLTRVDDVVVERPQHMWLRVALALWGEDLDAPEPTPPANRAPAAAGGPGPDGLARVRETYEMLSTKTFTHASPTLFNSGMRYQALASCFLTGIEDDSIEGIFEAMRKCALISKHGGGIGLHVSGVRAKGAPIRGTNGRSDGLVPMLRVANAVASYVNQGGRRKGSIAVYIEPHHPDVFDVLQLRRNSGDEHLRARDL
jgi:ribonucleotide reductase alpha subunit